MFKVGRKLSILLVSLLTPISVVFSPIVSYSTPPTTSQAITSPSRLWLMTPEDDERCRQDTERYNAAWTAAWYASHPGQGPAPTPSPPYVCPPPPPDTPTTPTNPTPVTPNKPIVPGTTQGTGLPNELENKPGNTPELNTGLGKPGEYKPGYDPATGLPVNGAEQANPNTGDPNDPQTGELARWAAANNTSPPQVNNGKPIVPANVGPDEPVHQPGQPIVPANVGPDAPKPPAPSKPEIIPNKPDNGSLNPVQKQPIEKVEKKVSNLDNPLNDDNYNLPIDQPTTPSNQKTLNEDMTHYGECISKEPKGPCAVLKGNDLNQYKRDMNIGAFLGRYYGNGIAEKLLKHYFSGEGGTFNLGDYDMRSILMDPTVSNKLESYIAKMAQTAANNVLNNPDKYSNKIQKMGSSDSEGNPFETVSSNAYSDVGFGMHSFGIHLEANVVASPPDTEGNVSISIQPRLNVQDVYDFNRYQYPEMFGLMQIGEAKPFIVKGAVDLVRIDLTVKPDGTVVSPYKDISKAFEIVRRK